MIRSRLLLSMTMSQSDSGAWLSTSFNRGIDIHTRFEFASDEVEITGRRIGNNRGFDRVEIWSSGLPIIRVSHDPNALVRLEFDEFERAGADRVLPHLRGRHMAGIDW